MNGDDLVAAVTAAFAPRYRVERRLRYRRFAAVRVSDGARVVLTVIRDGSDQGARFRFLRNVPLLASLEHPLLQALLDHGEMGEFAFAAMRAIDGEVLEDRLEGGRRLAVADACRIVADAAEGADVMHRDSLVHCDIDSTCIWVAEGRGVLGLCPEIYSDAEFGGNISYASPEQLTGDLAGPATDVYALGCALFHAVTGRIPFDANTTPEKFVAIIQGPRPVPSEHHRLAAPVDAIVRTALALDPAARFPSAAAMAAELRRIAPV